MQYKITLVLSVFVAAIIVLGAGAKISFAHKGAVGIVKQRMDAMDAIAAQMKQLRALLFAGGTLDREKVTAAATLIKQHALHTPKLFPQGSIKGPSEASPDIWKNWSQFKAQARMLADYAAKLEQLAKRSEPRQRKQAQIFFKNMAQTCKSCHQAYRVKKKH